MRGGAILIKFSLRFHFVFLSPFSHTSGPCLVVTAQNLQSINIFLTYLTLEISQYRKSGSTFPSSEQVAARSDCC